MEESIYFQAHEENLCGALKSSFDLEFVVSIILPEGPGESNRAQKENIAFFLVRILQLPSPHGTVTV